MSTPYNPNVPLPNSSPSQDQPILLANSQVINTAWGVDGVPFESSENIGFSNQRTLVRQAAAVAADENNGRIFSMNDTNGIAQLFWIAAQKDGAAISQITPVNQSSGAGVTGNYSYNQTIGGNSWLISQYFSILSTGLQIKFINIRGKLNTSVASVTVPYYGNEGVAAPFTTGVYAAFMNTLQLTSPTLGGVITGLYPDYAGVNGAGKTSLTFVPKPPSSTITYVYAITLMGV